MLELSKLDIDTIHWQKLIGQADSYLKRLFPICRSITGDGVRQTLSILREITDFKIKEVPSGTRCYDWTIPDEWNIKDAYIEDSGGKRIVDFKDNNVHVVNYSVPVNATITFRELEKHLYTLPRLPKAIPYRISYYNKDWGFCISHKQLCGLNKNAKYHVVIDSTLKPGKMTYAECLVKGSSDQEFLISTYCCHPSLANDNLSGQVLWALLLKEIKNRKTRHSYRFVISPETIGAICYLSKNEKVMRNIKGGFVLTTVAGPGKLGYKRTFLGDHAIDRVAEKTFRELNADYIPYPFDIISGSDERHYSSPYFRIPMGTICKDKYSEYDFYHTSLDNLDFINPKYLIETLKVYLLCLHKLEINCTYRSLSPYCEPMLSKRGLYPKISGHIEQKVFGSAGKPDTNGELRAILWVMFYSDGNNSVLDISEKTGMPMKLIYETSQKLLALKLLEKI